MDSPENSTEEQGRPDAENVKVPVRFAVPENMPSRYAHHMIVQPGETEVFLSFFEVVPPLLIGTPEEQRARLEQGVRAICTVRVAVPIGRFLDFTKAMQGIAEEITQAVGVEGNEPKNTDSEISAT